jgi:hypothetical protein
MKIKDTLEDLWIDGPYKNLIKEEGRVWTGFIWLWCKVDISFTHILINQTNFMDGPETIINRPSF